MSAPEPPAAARWLAAASHFGIVLAFLLPVLSEWQRNEIGGRELAGDLVGWPLFPIAIAAAVGAFSIGRRFVAVHVARAAVFHAVCAILMTILFRTSRQLPAAATGTLLVLLFGAWIVLPAAAATRALEGGMGWYPFVARIIPGPRAD